MPSDLKRYLSEKTLHAKYNAMIDWDNFSAGTAPLTIGVFLIGGVLLFIGLIGEYIFCINTRVIHRPIVVEEKRINFD